MEPLAIYVFVMASMAYLKLAAKIPPQELSQTGIPIVQKTK
jgi:hypothetical protein